MEQSAGFQGGARFSTWLRTIVLNQSLMRLRSLRRATLQSIDDHQDDERPMELPAHEPTQEATLGNSQLYAHLHAEVAQLPPIFREVIVLRDLESFSTEETAIRLGLSEPALKSRLSRARAMLRERMERHATGHSRVG